jgi:hypothetical protein
MTPDLFSETIEQKEGINCELNGLSLSLSMPTKTKMMTRVPVCFLGHEEKVAAQNGVSEIDHILN